MIIMHRRLTLHLAALAFFCTSAAAAAAPAPGDYDGDGKSDLATVDVNRSASTTTWLVMKSSGGVSKYKFGVPGDALTPGNFFAETHSKPAVVYVKDANQRLEWYIRRDNGRTSVRKFGMPGSTPVPGDYDCDGVADLAVRTPKDGTGYWSIAFASGQSATNIPFGFDDDRVFAADVTGDGCDEMVAVRNVRGLMYWFYRTYSNADYTTVQWGEPGDIPLKPMDMNNDGVPDFIIVRTLSRQLFAYVRYSPTSSQVIPLGASGTIPMTGNWIGSNGFGWYDKSARLFSFLNPETSEITTVKWNSGADALVRPDGSVAQFEHSERLGVSASGNDTAQCDKTLKKRDGSGNFTYNPNNSRKTLKVILPSSYNGKVQNIKAYDDGDVLDTLRQATPNEWGNRPRYYGSKSLGSYPNGLLLVISLKEGDQHCVTIDNPRQRQD